MTAETDVMAESRGLLQIGEFAKLAGSNLRTLRYYEELGLIRPASRSEGGFRFYEREQLDRMAAIKRLQELGLSLREIAQAFATNETGATGADLLTRLVTALQQQIELTQARIAKLESSLDELRLARARVTDVCIGCVDSFSRERCDPCPHDGVPIPSVLRALI